MRIADPAVAALLRPGARVDIMAGARMVASAVTVVAVPSGAVTPQRTDPAGPDAGALIVVSVPRRTAAALSGAAATSQLGVSLC